MEEAAKIRMSRESRRSFISPDMIAAQLHDFSGNKA
jgi:hypothetical protein